jgi:hypothetical protein
MLASLSGSGTLVPASPPLRCELLHQCNVFLYAGPLGHAQVPYLSLFNNVHIKYLLITLSNSFVVVNLIFKTRVYLSNV